MMTHFHCKQIDGHVGWGGVGWGHGLLLVFMKKMGARWRGVGSNTHHFQMLHQKNLILLEHLSQTIIDPHLFV